MQLSPTLHSRMVWLNASSPRSFGVYAAGFWRQTYHKPTGRTLSVKHLLF